MHPSEYRDWAGNQRRFGVTRIMSRRQAAEQAASSHPVDRRRVAALPVAARIGRLHDARRARTDRPTPDIFDPLGPVMLAIGAGL